MKPFAHELEILSRAIRALRFAVSSSAFLHQSYYEVFPSCKIVDAVDFDQASPRAGYDNDFHGSARHRRT